MRAVVTHVDGVRIALDRTVFYPPAVASPTTPGRCRGPAAPAVTEVRKQGAEVWHTLEGDVPAAAPR